MNAAINSQRNWIITREAISTIASLAITPFGIKKKNLKIARKQTQTTTVLIHGYMNNRSTLFPIATYLKAVGIKNIVYFDYKPSMSIEQSSLALKKFLKKQVKGGRINIIAHSLGGVIARHYLQLLNGTRRVDQCITIGTPHKGTYNAYWMPTKVGDQLRPDSPTMKLLEQTKHRCKDTRITSIEGSSDNIILPRKNTEQYKTIFIPSTGHMGLLWSYSCVKNISKILLSINIKK